MIKRFNPIDKVLILDFDHTCYDTDAFLMFEIRQAMLDKFNIPVDIWEKSYESAVRVGYSLEQHLEELIELLGYGPYSFNDISNFEKEINFSRYLYIDVLPFLKEAKNKGYKIMLLSFGASLWQNKKVSGVGLDKIMDVIKYTNIEGGKKELLAKYTENCKKVIFVENNGRDLDEVGRALPHVERYFMNRVPNSAMKVGDDDFMRVRYMESRKVAERQVELSHNNCHLLTEVVI